MKVQRTWVTLLLTFSLWLGLVLGCSSLRKGMEAKRIEREGPGITISAEDLYKAYESNESEADKLYYGKIVIVTGKVGLIEGNIRVVSLMNAPGQARIKCFFGSDQEEAVLKLETGQAVTVKGKGLGKHLGSVFLDPCALQ